MAMRIAWFKVNMPIYYYAAYFSKRAEVFDATIMANGNDAIRNRIMEINEKVMMQLIGKKHCYGIRSRIRNDRA